MLDLEQHTVSTVVITILVLIFGEITPKSIAKDYPEKFVMFSAPIICSMEKLPSWRLPPSSPTLSFWIWGCWNLDGVEIIQRIRTWPQMPIIVISARSEDSNKVFALDAGAII